MVTTPSKSTEIADLRFLAGLVPLFLFLSTPAHAYIGPGAGAGVIAVALGVIATIVLAFFAMLWYPIKRWARRRKELKDNANQASSE